FWLATAMTRGSGRRRGAGDVTSSPMASVASAASASTVENRGEEVGESVTRPSFLVSLSQVKHRAPGAIRRCLSNHSRPADAMTDQLRFHVKRQSKCRFEGKQ